MKRLILLISILLVVQRGFCQEEEADITYNGSTHCNPSPCRRGYNPYPTPCCPTAPCPSTPYNTCPTAACQSPPCNSCPAAPCSSNSCQPTPCNNGACYNGRGCNQPNCTCPPGTCRPGSCPCYPSAPARGVDCSLNVISMGAAFLLVIGVGALILSTSSHAHDGDSEDGS